MINPEIKSLKDFVWDLIFKFYRMGVQTSGKDLDDVLFIADGKIFWEKKNGAMRIFGKKLNRLIKANGKRS